jgi:2-furoate---CoA ligase
VDLGHAFLAAAARTPGTTAFVDGDLRRSYAEWRDEILRVAGGLAAMGLGRGDTLSVVMVNGHETATLYWACHMLGAVFAPFNWRAAEDEIAYVLRDADARLVAFDASGIAARAAAGALGFAPDRLIAAGGAEGGAAFESLAQSAPLAGPASAADAEICLLLYTSGTTGRPKGVPRSHGAERTAAASCIANQRYRFGDVALGVMPLFHTMGIRVMLCAAMLSGTFVAMRRFDPSAALALIGAERVTSLFLVPTMFHDMLHHADCASADLSSVRHVAYAGMPMTGVLETLCRERFAPEVFCNYYGSSEIFTFAFCDRLDRKPGCAGHAGLNQEIRVVRADAAGRAGPDDVVPAGEVGEVIASMRSAEAFAGYRNRPDADAKAIRQGWYFTGDLGRLDADGALYLCGRIDDMIISGGENIHPEEVEDTLAACPGVAQAAVVGLPDARLGHAVTAFVEPADATASAAALDAYCRASSLARFKRPRAYIFVRRLPRSASGKLLRRLLREGAYEPLDGSDPHSQERTS